jgi:hypothetical protein
MALVLASAATNLHGSSNDSVRPTRSAASIAERPPLLRWHHRSAQPCVVNRLHATAAAPGPFASAPGTALSGECSPSGFYYSLKFTSTMLGSSSSLQLESGSGFSYPHLNQSRLHNHLNTHLAQISDVPALLDLTCLMNGNVSCVFLQAIRIWSCLVMVHP